MKRKRRFLKKTRSLKRLLKETLIFSLILAILTLFYFFFRSDLLRVKNLVCSVGRKRCSQEVWAGIFNLVSDQSIISLSQKFLAKNIKEKYPQFQKVKIKIQFPNVLRVELVERRPLVLVIFDPSFTLNISQENNFLVLKERFEQEETILGAFWLIDEEGIALKKEAKGLDLPRVMFNSQKEIKITQGVDLSKFPFGNSLEIFRLLREVGLSFDYALVEEKKKLVVVFTSDWQALFFLDKKAKSQVDSLQLILKQTKIEGQIPKIIDLRFDKPIIKFH